MEPEYIEFFLNSKSELIQFETIELSHPNFSQVFRLVRNNTQGLTATLETLASVTFDYCPMSISKGAQQGDLDFALEVEVGDVGEILQAELDLIQTADSFATKPSFIYRTFRSDDLTQPMYGPLTMEIQSIAYAKEGFKIEARSPFLSISQTGLVFTIEQFPTLASFL